MNKKSIILSLALAMFFAFALCGSSFAASSDGLIGPVKYNNTDTTLTATAISSVKITEIGNDSYATDGYLTLTIPSEVALYNIGTPSNWSGGSITRSTTYLGSSTSKKSLYVYGTGGTNRNILFFRYGNSQYGIMNVFTSGAYSTAQALCFGTGASTGYSLLADISDWSTVATPSDASTSTEAVGTIYFNDTTSETVIELGVKEVSTTSADFILLASGMQLKPAALDTTGDVSLAMANGNVAGTAPIGITAGSEKVLVLVTQPGSLSGTASTSTVPQINAGAVAAQPIGKIKLTLVGDAAASTASTIVFTLDGGAKFHTDAGTPGVSRTGVPTAQVADADFSVNSSGALVLTIPAADSQHFDDTDTFTISSAGTSDFINADSITAAGDINATVTGTGAYAALSQSVKVATAALPGTAISFVDNTTTGLTSLYAGRKGHELGTDEYVLVGENAPTSLLGGGSITMALSSGAKFQTSSTVDISAYTTTPYASGLVVGTDPSAAASTSISISVSTPSSGNRGAFKVGKNSSDWLDLSNATAGPLQMTLSGTAGASGTVTIATVINATTTTALSTPTIVPGTTVTLPDLQIVEGKYGALETGFIGLKIPSSFSIDTTVTPTVTATDAAGTASTTAVTHDSWDSTDKVIWFQVNTASTSTGGLYTVVISGLKATVTSTASTSDTTFVVGGATSASYSSSTFNSNTGAKPTSETVTFCSIVSATVPFAGTPVVSGTVITQTFIPAGNDIGKVGDVYVWYSTSAGSAMYYAGSAWSATETPYSAGNSLATLSVVYDVSGLPGSQKVYIGYGIGSLNTASQMNSNATFVLAYTTAAAPAIVPVVIPATAGAAVTATINTTDTYTLNLATTNAAGATPTAEYVVYQVIVSGTASGWWFLTPTGTVQQYTAGMDLSTVLYDTAAAGSVAIGQYKLGTYLPTAGDQLIIAYVYSTSTIDIADPTSYVVENVVTMTVQ